MAFGLRLARTVLCAVLRAQARAAEARQVAETGVRDLERMSNLGAHAVALYLELAEACFMQGDVRGGRPPCVRL